MTDIERIVDYLRRRAREAERYAFTDKGECFGRDLGLGEATGFDKAADEIESGKWSEGTVS